VIEEWSGVGVTLAFHFTHAFFRQTLYEEIFAARRIRWHQQVARALETVHARRLEEHAAELAAKRAMSVYAHGDAVRPWGCKIQAAHSYS
jgi:hypothetical protein